MNAVFTQVKKADEFSLTLRQIIFQDGCCKWHSILVANSLCGNHSVSWESLELLFHWICTSEKYRRGGKNHLSLDVLIALNNQFFTASLLRLAFAINLTMKLFGQDNNSSQCLASVHAFGLLQNHSTSYSSLW